MTSTKIVFSLLALALWSFATPACAEELRLFTARYQVRFHGISGGVLQLTLRKGAEPGVFVYESTADPSLLGSIMISDGAKERTTLRIVDGEVRPIEFVSDDGKKGDEKDSNVTFDWANGRLRGRSERANFDEPLPPRVQDHLSIQIAVIYALDHQIDLGNYTLLDAGALKNYTYVKKSSGTVKFKGRTLDAAIVESSRTDSTGGRINRYWHAAELHNLPVRAERSRDGKVDLTMELLDVNWTE